MRNALMPIVGVTNQLRKWERTLSSGGFTLVEVLVSVFVLSIGLLGMVGMQAKALQANREARLQSTAVVLARELAEMMRGNRIEAVKTSANPYVGSFSSPLVFGSPTYCLSVAATACTTSNDVAKSQMTEWLTRVGDQLPGARVDICFDSAPYDGSGKPQWACTAGVGATAVVKIGWTRGSTDRSQSGNAGLERAEIPSIILPLIAGSAT